MIDKAQKIREEVERLKSNLVHGACASQIAMETRCKEEAYDEVISLLDSLQEEPVSDDLVVETNNYCVNVRKGYPRVMDETDRYICNAFKAGAQWQKENLWKAADDDSLPIFDREVIALTQPYPLEGNEYAVSFAHRPNPDGWDGKSIITEKIEHYTPMTYGKGGWNIPNVKYWLDCSLPNMED